MTTPAGQRWMREKPTEPGWYWHRTNIHGQEVCRVRYGRNQSLVVLFVDGAVCKIEEMMISEWQGPLTPNEATE